MSTHSQAEQVGIGAYVELELIDEWEDRESLQFQLVPAQHANLAQGLLGANTPLAQAIRAKFAGDEVDYQMGEIRRVRIVSVQRMKLGELEDTAQQQAEALRRAKSAVDQANAQSFAASYSSKWGGYDPEGLEDKGN